jgi:hypothetical protein
MILNVMAENMKVKISHGKEYSYRIGPLQKAALPKNIDRDIT